MSVEVMDMKPIISITPRAFAEGHQACLDGKPRLNPNGTNSRAGWLQGYDAAQAVRDEWEWQNHERAKATEW